jgi:uncharacterized repeat protein (TIGR03803 family)
MKSYRLSRCADVLVSKISSRRMAIVLAILAVLGMGLLATPSAQAQGYVSTLLHSFTGSPSDGETPYSGLIEDASGNLYGTTYGTGIYIVGGPNNFGNVYELVNSSGTYTYKVLHSFDNGDGAYPVGGLIMDASGNLYGTTSGGGQANNGYGTVFELVNSSGTYTETILHNFMNNGVDGYLPMAGVIMDASGNLYGTTLDGGANFAGAVYELVNSSGAYTERILYSFVGGTSAGGSPKSGLIMDASGNLYGTATSIVYELVNSSGTYAEKVLYSSQYQQMYAGVIMDASGNLYGATTSTAFELVNSSGAYSVKTLHTFGPSASCTVDGTLPAANLLMDASGHLFGTTSQGGSATLGTVFEIVPFSGTSSPSSISITSSVNPATTGKPVQFMLSVNSTSVFSPTTGTVSLLNGATVLGSAPLACDAAIISLADAGTIGLGTFTLTAQYMPDIGAFAPTSTTISQTINEPNVVLTENQTINGTVTSAGAGSGFFGNGSGLSNLNPASLSVGTAGINITGNAATATVAAMAVTSTSATTAANSTALGGVAAANYARLNIANSFNGNQTVTGDLTVSAAIKGASLAIGGGTPIAEYVSITQSVTLPALSSASNADAVISPCATFTTAALTGFTPGASDAVALGIPKSLSTGLGTGVFLVYQAWENSATASPTLTIQVCNSSGLRYKGGASGFVRVDIAKH